MSGWKKTKIVSFLAKGKQKTKRQNAEKSKSGNPFGGIDRRNTLNSIDVTKSFKACAWIDGVESGFFYYREP